jgi:hemerythrin-like domain-containing protein
MSAPQPNLAQDLVRIHKVITRSIDVTMITGIQHTKNGFTSPEELTGYRRYTHCLVEVLDSHHQSEDHIGFPALHKVLPTAPYARLTAEHHQIEHLLGILRPAIEHLSTDSEGGLSTIVDTLQKIMLLWPSHYGMEEKNFTADALNAVMSLEEQKRISDANSKYSQDHSHPAEWVVPFVLFNLEKEDREVMIASMPPVIIQELVPKAWKEQWAPMQRLLLE